MGFKVCYLMDARSKYLTTLDVYAGASRGESALKGFEKGEANQGQKIVSHLKAEDLHHKGHVIMIVNFSQA